jgi:hypothetical protein
MRKATVGGLPGGNGDTEWCAGLELWMDVAQKTRDDVIAIANDFFEFGG